jgi:hypothetical protein
MLLGGILGGCAKPGEAVYQSAWDGQASQWEPPPSRMVGAADGGLSGGVGGPTFGGGLGGWTSVCTKSDQGNCCYDGKSGHPSGIPSCAWQRLAPGESTTISSAFKDGQKVKLPVPVTLTNVSPAAYATYDDCLKAPVGFVLSGAGMEEGELLGDIAHYDLKSNGTWQGRGGGGEIGLVAGRDPQGTGGDGGPASPSYTRHEGLCAPLKDTTFTGSIELFDQIDFEIGGVKYTTDFRANPNGGVTGYYVVVQKSF